MVEKRRLRGQQGRSGVQQQRQGAPAAGSARFPTRAAASFACNGRVVVAHQKHLYARVAHTFFRRHHGATQRAEMGRSLITAFINNITVNKKKCENAEMTDEICVASTHTFIVLQCTKVYIKNNCCLYLLRILHISKEYKCLFND